MSLHNQVLTAISPDNQTFTVIGKHGHPPPGALGAPSNLPPLVLPPMNTNISTVMLPEYKLGSPSSMAIMDAQPPLPTNWDWRHSYPEDKNYTDMKSKKKLIEKPRNQHLCGSCWAISTAGIVSDMFVAKGLTNYAPKLSMTYLLSETTPIATLGNPCHSKKCAGGSNALAFKCIEENGLASEFCVNNAWCTTNNVCMDPKASVQGGKEFSARDKTEYLNSQIPPSGCFYPENKELYYIKDVQVSPSLNNENVDKFRVEAKHNLIEHGPVSSGYIVYSNFVRGDYSPTKGIYLEAVDYEKSSSNNIVEFAPDTRKNMVGAHAITVIGWGVEDDVQYAPGKSGTIHYWYCRNSWGEQWGKDNGYFKFAMWPYNNRCGFDNPMQGLGGFVSAIASEIKSGKINKKIPDQYMKGDDKNFYKNENKPNTNGGDDSDRHRDNGGDSNDRHGDNNDGDNSDHSDKGDVKTHKNMTWIIVVSVLGGLVVLGLIIWLLIYLKLLPRMPKFGGFMSK